MKTGRQTAGRAATGCHGRDPAPTGRIRLGKGRIWPEEPAAAAMAEVDGGRADGGPRPRDGRPGKADPPAGKRIHRRRRATRGRAAAAAAVMTLREGVKNGFGARGLPPPGARRAPRGSAAAMRRVVAGSHLSSVTMLQMKERVDCVSIDRGPLGYIYKRPPNPRH